MTSAQNPQNTNTASSPCETGKAAASVRPRRYGLQKLCGWYRLNRRGASVVEFAVVAPVFLLLVFGMLEYGRMVMVQQLLTNATREGARRAVLDGATATEVKGVVVDYLNGSSITVSAQNVTITPSSPSDAGFGEPVQVSVTVPFSQVSWLPTPMFLGDVTMQSKSVMRRESVQ